VNDGFFSKEETQAKLHPKKTTGCGICGLKNTCKSPKLEPFGTGGKKILIIGEAPSAKEDRRGELNMAGDASIFLRRVFRKHDIDLENDCRKINAICCYPGTDKEGKSREPTDKEIEACRPRIWKEIEELQPHLILLFGNAAIKSFLKHRWQKDLGGVNKWRGFTIPDRDTQAWVCATYHPSAVKEHDDFKPNPAVETIFKQDIETALSCLDRDRPEGGDDRKCVELLHDPEDIADLLSDIRRQAPPILSHDYEATGLKPHREGHRLVSLGLSYSPDKAYAFLMKNMTDGALRAWKAILLNKKIGKTAHHLKFESMWSRVKLEVETQRWLWDSMLAAHVIDNRPDITGLKVQTYLLEGVVDYDSEISEFLKATDEEREKHGANAINRIDEAPISDLLTYNGLDALYGLRITIKQMETLKNHGMLMRHYESIK
jgi:DNA polymerase